MKTTIALLVIALGAALATSRFAPGVAGRVEAGGGPRRIRPDPRDMGIGLPADAGSEGRDNPIVANDGGQPPPETTPAGKEAIGLRNSSALVLVPPRVAP